MGVGGPLELGELQSNVCSPIGGTDEALKDVKASQYVLLDMETGRLTKESVGLPDGTSQVPDIYTGRPIEVIIEAPYKAITAT
ncbi:hypothetical protein [Pseudarthrobacter sp. NIBRBAC000502770]|uniref:hypothetical protein n=1 Tax=Pseudarthrobacter sp. NIBRBAC000502770 TaxID=2590785 RepID=UPI001140339F|nr:hypothetical protein [Pseudarthrobacter sp. NIBRBAC000502770]QDG89076.1 hypothetical protein NIBR502770_11735 [Pseudarthrobacter sp. NIBRBAC000502770]